MRGHVQVGTRDHARFSRQRKHGAYYILCALTWGLSCATAQAAEQLTLHALFKNKAIVLVDGARRVLTQGDTSPEGVKLVDVDTNTEEAVVEVNGRREVLRLGVVISAFGGGGRGGITLYAEPNGYFFAEGSIDGTPIRFLVDTGATSIAINSKHAERIGIDYKRHGKPSFAGTAGGVVRMYAIKLGTVEVGGIRLHNVDAGVIEGNHPREALLGMSFLGRLDMKRDGEKMELTQRY